MKSTSPFERMRDILVNMTPEHRDRLIEAHKAFGRLKSFCEAKGYIEVLPSMSGIKVLKNKPEVKELKAVISFLQPGNFKWVNTAGIDEHAKKK